MLVILRKPAKFFQRSETGGQFFEIPSPCMFQKHDFTDNKNPLKQLEFPNVIPDGEKFFLNSWNNK
jgi:hypothetical protein